MCFLFCLFFLYKEGYLSLSKDDNDIAITDKKEENNEVKTTTKVDSNLVIDKNNEEMVLTIGDIL